MKGRIQHTAIWSAILFTIVGLAAGWYAKPSFTVGPLLIKNSEYREKIYQPWYPMFSEEAFYREIAEYCGYKTVIVGVVFKHIDGYALYINQATDVLIANNSVFDSDGGFYVREEQDLDQIRAEDDPF